MDDQKERQERHAKQHMQEFMEGLEEVNDKIEVINNWRSVGRSLDRRNTKRTFRNAEALYRMATNVIDNTDYAVTEEERDILLETEACMEDAPEYVEVEFEAYKPL